MCIPPLWVTGWYFLDKFVIPRYFIPEIQAYINKSNQKSPIKLSVGKIDFHIFRGFLLKGVEIASAKKEPLITAREVDVDLKLWPLLSKRVEISSFKVDGASIYAERNRQGSWNMGPVFALGIMTSDRQKGWEIRVDQFDFKKTTFHFADRLDPRRQLTRNFRAVDLALNRKAEGLFEFMLRAEDEQKEKITLKLEFSRAGRSGRGEISFDTTRFADYWQSYLAGLFTPWELQARRLSGNARFEIMSGGFSVAGKYKVTGGAVKNGTVRFTGTALITHNGKCLNGQWVAGENHAAVELKNITGYCGPLRLFQKGSCRLTATEKELAFEELDLHNGDLAARLKGKMSLQPSIRLVIKGRINQSDHALDFQVLPGKRARLSWQMTGEAASLKLSTSIPDLERLIFNATLKGAVNFSGQRQKFYMDLGPPHNISIEVSENTIKGKTICRAWATGKAFAPGDWQGWMVLDCRNFSIVGLPPRDIQLRFKANNGLFSAGIPESAFSGGRLKGLLLLDFNRWGAEVEVKDCDISGWGAIDKRLAGMKGNFSGKVALIGPWVDYRTVSGGGYFSLENGDLKQAEIFSLVEKGIGKYVQDFKLPNFKSLQGVFSVGEKKCTIERARGEAKNMRLNFIGSADFSGETDLTIGIQLFRGGWLNTMRQVIFPITISLDILSDAIKVHVTGKWPNLNQSTEVQPLSWFQALGSHKESVDPDQYSLDKIWH